MSTNKLLEKLKLKKPLIIFDLEATGLAVLTDRVVELAYIKIWPDGKVVKDDILINPEMSIPTEASGVHGIKNKDVENAPTFKDLSQDLIEVFKDCIYSGFNVVRFDLPMLKREFIRFGIAFEYTNQDIIDASTIFSNKEPRTLIAAYKFYCGKEHKGAHRALADVEVTLEVLEGQLSKYEDLQNPEILQKLHTEKNSRYVDSDRKFYWRDGKAHFSFSKFKDQSLEHVAKHESGFLNWMLNADFQDEIKDIIRNAQKGEYPEKKD